MTGGRAAEREGRAGALLALLSLVAACGGGAAVRVAPPPGMPAMPALDAPAAKAELPPEDDAAVPIEADDASWGSRLAPVTIVEFSDFQCPFCSRVVPTLGALKQEYGPEKLRVVFKHYPLPFHANARAAAEAAQGMLALGGPAAFWGFHDRAFASQKDLGEGAYVAWARELGVNGTALRAGLEAHTWAEQVARDEESAKKVGVSGTPAFFVNGTALSGAQPMEKFRAIVDAEAAKALEALSRGTPRERLYRAMAQVNYQKPPPEEEEETVSKDVFKVPVGASPSRGPKAALVTIVEFADFQCPYCKKAEATMSALRRAYGDDVRFVWKNQPLPFHARAEPAAHAALEARALKGDAAFWDVHDRLMQASALEDADLAHAAKAAGIDDKRVLAAAASHKHFAALGDDAELGDSVGAGATPTFFVNGRRVIGAQDEATFRAVIDEELKKARAQVAAGVPAAQLYDRIAALGKVGAAPPPPEKRSAPLSQTAPFRGAASAAVVVQEFADFECPYCQRAEAVLADLVRSHGARVKFVWRNMPLPFHKHAELAAEAALEAQAQQGNAGFFKMGELLFAAKAGLERTAIEGYAAQLGLDMAKFRAALDGHAHKSKLDADGADAKAASVEGTPAFFIGPYFVSGAMPYWKMRRVVDQALREAGAASQGGPAGAKP